MATVYSAQKTKWSQNNPTERVKTNEQAGRIRVAYATYEASSLSIGDVIQMFNIPNGARLLRGWLAYDALASSTTLSVGNAAYTDSSGSAVSLSAAGYLAAVSTASAGRTECLATIALGSGAEVDADKDGLPVTLTLAGAAATGTIALTFEYVVD